LSTKTDEFLHQRLIKRKLRERLRGKNSTEDKIAIRILTSSKQGVVELPAKRPYYLPSSTLALFGEGARGLATGGDFSKSC
jgi:hypothetical protein